MSGASRIAWHVPEVRRLCDVAPTSGTDVWRLGSELEIDAQLREAVALVESQLSLRSKCEFDHYGSGYASFVDAWFFRATGELSVEVANDYPGVMTLLSREFPVFVVGQASKSWSKQTASSYLPFVGLVDAFQSADVEALAERVASVLAGVGLIRLHRRDLEPYLPANVRVPTILSSPPFRLFDAVFHWED